MITLKVEPYCENCRDFFPEAHKEIMQVENNDPEWPGIQNILSTTVICKFARRCECIKRYLKEEQKHVND